jgi:hypothetical protein
MYTLAMKIKFHCDVKVKDSKAREINNFNKLENDGGQLAAKIGSLSKGAYLLN